MYSVDILYLLGNADLVAYHSYVCVQSEEEGRNELENLAKNYKKIGIEPYNVSISGGDIQVFRNLLKQKDKVLLRLRKC